MPIPREDFCEASLVLRPCMCSFGIEALLRIRVCKSFGDCMMALERISAA